MNFDLSQVIAKLGPDYAFKVANGARTPADYLFSSLLPERNKPTYNAQSGGMTVRSLMAGLTGMDAPFAPTGLVEASTFSELTAKITNEARLTEASLRQLQALVQAATNSNGTPIDMSQEVLNFLNKVIIQAQMDTAEWARGEALLGSWSWTFNGKVIAVDYGVNALGNLLTNRTGTDAYSGSTSKFWADIATIRTKLRGGLTSIIAHPDTIEMIMNNSANNIRVLQQANGDGIYEFQQYASVLGQATPNEDKRYSVQIIAYSKEGEILDPANPGTPIRVPFMTRGKLLATGKALSPGYQVGQGSTLNPLAELELGYTHMGPTVEGGNQMGRWARLYTPEATPMQLVGQGVSNIMPVIENPGRIVIASTDIA